MERLQQPQDSSEVLKRGIKEELRRRWWEREKEEWKKNQCCRQMQLLYINIKE